MCDEGVQIDVETGADIGETEQNIVGTFGDLHIPVLRLYGDYRKMAPLGLSLRVGRYTARWIESDVSKEVLYAPEP